MFSFKRDYTKWMLQDLTLTSTQFPSDFFFIFKKSLCESLARITCPSHSLLQWISAVPSQAEDKYRHFVTDYFHALLQQYFYSWVKLRWICGNLTDLGHIWGGGLSLSIYLDSSCFGITLQIFDIETVIRTTIVCFWEKWMKDRPKCIFKYQSKLGL